MLNESATSTPASNISTSINSSLETTTSHADAYAAKSAKFVDGHVSSNPEIYAKIFAASLDVLGLNDTVLGLSEQVLGLGEDSTRAFRFFTFLTLFVVLVGALQVYNVYCTNKTRKKTKKYYTSLHDGIELPVHAVRTKTENADD